MLKIRRHVYCNENKGELTASGILRRISSRESFNVGVYFKPKADKAVSYSRLPSLLPLKVEKKEYFNPWEIKNSLKAPKSLRCRHREVIDKIKLKNTNVKPVDFSISRELKFLVNRSENILKFK